MACAVEEAGFERRDQIQWLFAPGFPKARDLGKEEESPGGCGTALKPANGPICPAGEPPVEKTIVASVPADGIEPVPEHLDVAKAKLDNLPHHAILL